MPTVACMAVCDCEASGSASLDPQKHETYSVSPTLSLRVHRTRIWSMQAFCIRNRNYGFGYIPSNWGLGTLRVWDVQGSTDCHMPGKALKDTNAFARYPSTSPPQEGPASCFGQKLGFSTRVESRGISE